MRDKLGRFIKGHKVLRRWIEISQKTNTGRPGWNKGKKMSQQTCEKLRQISLNMPQDVKNKIRNTIKKLWKNPEYRKNMREKHRKIFDGRLKSFYGYIMIYKPDHPYAIRQKQSYVPEHRLIMENHIGRYLRPSERVHHINGIKDDNRIENLKLFKDSSSHAKYHFPECSKFGSNSL